MHKLTSAITADSRFTGGKAGCKGACRQQGSPSENLV